MHNTFWFLYIVCDRFIGCHHALAREVIHSFEYIMKLALYPIYPSIDYYLYSKSSLSSAATNQIPEMMLFCVYISLIGYLYEW